MQIDIDKNGLTLVPSTEKDAYEIGFVSGCYDKLSDALKKIIVIDEARCRLRINHAYVGACEKQMRLVDDLLGWKGTGNGRIDRINELLEAERNLMQRKTDEQRLGKIANQSLDRPAS